MRPGLPQPVRTDSDGEEKQRAGERRGIAKEMNILQ